MSITLESMEITLDYKFAYKPLLVGGGAMEYYGLRPRGADIDFILHEKDYNASQPSTQKTRRTSMETLV